MNNRKHIRTLTGVAIFTALVIILQLLGSFIKFGPFSISLTLIPIVVGAALYGPSAGAWLGLVFGITVLLSGDAAPFLVVSAFGTVLTVLLKGALAGLLAGIVYKALRNTNIWVASVCAALICPVPPMIRILMFPHLFLRFGFRSGFLRFKNGYAKGNA